MAELIGTELATQPTPEGRSRQITWSEIEEADPDVVIVACCGFDLERNVEYAPSSVGLPLLESAAAHQGKAARTTIAVGDECLGTQDRFVDYWHLWFMADHHQIPLDDFRRVMKACSHLHTASFLTTTSKEVELCKAALATANLPLEKLPQTLKYYHRQPFFLTTACGKKYTLCGRKYMLCGSFSASVVVFQLLW